MRSLVFHLDDRVALLHRWIAARLDQPPRRLAWLCTVAMPPVLLGFLLAASEVTGVAALGWLLVPGTVLAGLLASGLRPDGPPRALAADPASRLMALATLVAALAAATMARPGLPMLALWLGVALAALGTAALHFEALPPQPPHRRRVLA